MNKAELLRRIRTGHDQLEATLARLSEDQMCRPVLPGQWSIKDVLAHLGAWEQFVVRSYETLLRGEIPDHPVDEVALDAINARIHAENRDRLLVEIRRDEHDAYRNVCTLVENAAHEDLFDPRRFTPMAGKPFAEWVSNNTYEHYAEHLENVVVAWPAQDLTRAQWRGQMEEIILAFEKGAMERWRNGDPWGWAEISAEEVTYVDPGLTQPIIGIEAYKAYLKQAEGKIFYQGSEFIDPKVVAAGDAAVLTYNYRSTVIGPGATVASQILWNATEVYFRLAGRWRIAHTHWSFVNHKLPGRVEVPIPVELSHREYAGVLGEVMALESGAMARWRHGDPWGFIEISAPGVTYFDTGTPQRLNGLDALKAEYVQREGKIYYDVMEFIAPMVQVRGDVAVLTYRFFSTRLNPDGSISSRTPWNCTEVFARNAGGWKIIHTHWSLIRGERM